METIAQVNSNTSTSSVEIGDYIFCSHGKEQCADCDADYREDNAFTAGLDPNPERDSITAEYVMSKDGEPQCKKHKSTTCSNCFGFKKQIVKLNKDSAKAAKKNKKETTNLY